MSVDEVKGDGAAKPEEPEPKLAETNAKPATAAKARPAKPAQAPKRGETWVETIQTVAIALVIALIVRSFLFQPFNIPSGSMENTLLVGDFLFVEKFAYGYSRYSLPFSLPLIPDRVFFTPPKRGDVVVFKTPLDNRTDYIKRVIGLPGDQIQMKMGVLYINGVAVPKVPAGTYLDTNKYGVTTAVPRYKETLPNGKSYYVLDREPDGPLDSTDVYVVPPGHYFMMGDNRDNSTDSRVPQMFGGVGYVPAVNLVGKAEILFFSVHAPHPLWKIWNAVRYNRIFKVID